jgi:predicted nucleic acid-binding Zn ribbon protein
MPTYLGRCPECEYEEEYWAKMDRQHEDCPFCPDCGEQMDSVPIVNEGGFILKGDGWHRGGGFT